ILGRALRAFAQRFECAALRIEGAVGVAFAEMALRRSHFLTGIAERGIAFEAQTFQFLEEFLQPLTQRALLLAEFSQRAGFASLVFAVLVWTPGRLASGAGLTFAEGAITQIALLADHVAKLVERARRSFGAFVHWTRPGGLKAVQHIAQFRQKIAGGIPIAA